MGWTIESVTNQPAISWTESIKWGVKTPAIVHGRVRNDVEKQWEEHQQMKIPQQNEDTTTKMKIKNKQQQHKNLAGSSPKQVTLLGVFDFLKNDYRSIINITLISSIVFHMVSTSTFNKDNG